MDFVQRNLINERNNLQIELAKAKALIAELQETYRITPVRRDLLNKIEGTAMRDASNAVGPDGEDYRASSLKKHDRAMSRISRIQMIKMMGKPADKRTFEEHPTLRYFPDDRDPKDLKDKAIKSDLKAERVREISNRPKKKKLNEQAEYISSLENVIVSIAESMNMSVEELMELNARNMGRLAAMARQHNAGPSNMTGSRSGLKPLGGDIQPATNVGYRLAGMLGSAGVHGAAENMQGKVVASQRHPSGGYNQDSSVISDKTPVEFKNPDVKPDTMARAAAKVRDGSKGAQQDRARTAALKAAAAERASRTF